MPKIVSRLAAWLALVLGNNASSADSQFVTDLMRLTQERDKALAAAAAPINKKYRVALDDLLRRATKASDLDAALKIRGTIESMASAKSGAVDPAQVKTKRGLQKALIGSRWSFAPDVEAAQRTTFTFTLTESEAQWSNNTKTNWEPVDERSIRIGPGADGSWSTVIFDSALTSYQSPDWYGGGPRYGVRKSR